MSRMSHFCRQWRLKPSASKTISSVFHLHNTSAIRELSVYLHQTAWPAHSAWVPPNLSRGDSRPYAVLQRTLDEDCRQAEEPKQLVDEASRFHLHRQRQHSTVISSGAFLFSSRVLRPSHDNNNDDDDDDDDDESLLASSSLSRCTSSSCCWLRTPRRSSSSCSCAEGPGVDVREWCWDEGLDIWITHNNIQQYYNTCAQKPILFHLHALQGGPKKWGDCLISHIFTTPQVAPLYFTQLIK